MSDHYGPQSHFRVGVGTLCARADAATIRRVVNSVATELPGVPLHLWGVKLSVLKSRTALHGRVVSVDSAAWNARFGRGCETTRKGQQDMGLTQREYDYLVSLPDYLRKVETSLAATKQVQMVLEEQTA